MPKKDEVKYSVIAKNGKFRRSNIEFSLTPLILDEIQITKEILSEPMLIVTKFIPEEKKEEKEK